MQEELMNPLTAQTFNKDNSPVCRRSHHKIMQEKGSLFPSLLFPSPSVHGTCGTAFVTGFGGPTAIPLHNKQQECFGSLFLHPVYGTSLTERNAHFTLSGISVPPQRRNQRRTLLLPVSRDHNVSVADLEFDWGFRQPSTVCQNIKTSSRRDIFAFQLPLNLAASQEE